MFLYSWEEVRSSKKLPEVVEADSRPNASEVIPFTAAVLAAPPDGLLGDVGSDFQQHWLSYWIVKKKYQQKSLQDQPGNIIFQTVHDWIEHLPCKKQSNQPSTKNQ